MRMGTLRSTRRRGLLNRAHVDASLREAMWGMGRRVLGHVFERVYASGDVGDVVNAAGRLLTRVSGATHAYGRPNALPRRVLRVACVTPASRGSRARLRRVDGGGSVEGDAGPVVVGSKDITGPC